MEKQNLTQQKDTFTNQKKCTTSLQHKINTLEPRQACVMTRYETVKSRAHD